MIISKLATIMLWGIAMGITSGVGVLMLVQYIQRVDRREKQPDGAIIVPMCLLGASVVTAIVGLVLVFSFAKELSV